MSASSPFSIGAYEAKIRFSDLLTQVEGGQEVTITRHGVPVARLVPVQRTKSAEEIQAIFDAWDKRSAGLRLGELHIRDLIEEGRK